MTLCYTPEKVSFLFLDDLGNISTLLDKDYDFEKKHNQPGSKYTQNMYGTRVKFTEYHWLLKNFRS